MLSHKYANSEDAIQELASVSGQLDAWEAHEMEKLGRPKPFVSDFLKLSTGGRIHIDRYGASQARGGKVFINDRNSDLIAALTFSNDEEAELELLSINEQIDACEAYRARKQVGPVRRPFRD